MQGSEEDEYTKLLEQHLNDRGAKHEQKRKPRIIKSIPKNPTNSPNSMPISPQSKNSMRPWGERSSRPQKPILNKMPKAATCEYGDNFRASLGFCYIGVSEVDLPPNAFRPSSLKDVKSPEAWKNATSLCFNSAKKLCSYWYQCKSISDARDLPKLALKPESSQVYQHYWTKNNMKGLIDVLYQEPLNDESAKCGVCMIPLSLTESNSQDRSTVSFSAANATKSDCYLVIIHQKSDQILKENNIQVGRRQKNCIEIDVVVTYEKYQRLSKNDRNVCFSFTQRLQQLFEEKINEINLDRERLLVFTARRACFDMELKAEVTGEKKFEVNGKEHKMKTIEYSFEDGTKPGLWRIDGLYDDMLPTLEDLTDDLHRRTMTGDLLDNTFSCTFSNTERLQRTKFFFGARYIWGDGTKKEDVKIAEGIRVDVNEVEEWQLKAAERLVQAKVMKDNFANQFACNIYRDGSLGISPHFDDNKRFYPWIYSLRLFGDTRLSFGCGIWGKGGGRFFVPLPRGAILIMQSDSPAMMKYKHSVRNEDLTGKNGVMIWRRVWEHLLVDAKRLLKRGGESVDEEPSLDEPLTQEQRRAILRGDYNKALAKPRVVRPIVKKPIFSLSGGYGGV